MIKSFFSISFILLCFLFANENTIKQDKSLVVVKEKLKIEQNKYKKYVKQEVKKYLHKNIVKDIYGKLNIEFYINAKKGKIIYFLLYKKEGNRKFTKFIKNKLKNIKKIKLKSNEQLINNPLVKIRLNIVFDTLPKLSRLEKLSLLKFNQNSNKEYYKYINYLIYSKKINKDKIKNILRSKANSFYKAMLYAIYFDYLKNNNKEAKKYYLMVLKQYNTQMGEKEKLIISDWLIRNGYFKKILEVFPDWSCTKYKNKDEKHQCYYYQAVAKYFLHKKCKTEMSIAQAYYSDKLDKGDIKWQLILKK